MQPLIELKAVSKNYSQQTLFKNLNFSLQEGEIALIEGCSGSGKSTLTRLITKLEPSDSGNFYFKGIDYSQFNYKQMLSIKKEVALVWQGAKESFSPYYSVKEELLNPALFYKKTEKEELEEELNQWMVDFQLNPSLITKKINEVSGGEADRFALIRALLCHPSLLIMDESTASLNQELKISLFNRLIKCNMQTNLSFIIISHQEVLPYLPKAVQYRLEKGRLACTISGLY